MIFVFRLTLTFGKKKLLDKKHNLSVELWEGRIFFSIRCNWPSLDEDRPCWPYTEDGEPEPSPQYVCTYVTWIENIDPCELHHGSIEIENWPFHWEWQAWDQPRLILLSPSMNVTKWSAESKSATELLTKINKNLKSRKEKGTDYP